MSHLQNFNQHSIVYQVQIHQAVLFPKRMSLDVSKPTFVYKNDVLHSHQGRHGKKKASHQIRDGHVQNRNSELTISFTLSPIIMEVKMGAWKMTGLSPFGGHFPEIKFETARRPCWLQTYIMQELDFEKCHGISLDIFGSCEKDVKCGTSN